MATYRLIDIRPCDQDLISAVATVERTPGRFERCWGKKPTQETFRGIYAWYSIPDHRRVWDTHGEWFEKLLERWRRKAEYEGKLKRK